MLSGCTPKGFSKYIYPIVVDYTDKPNDYTSQVDFSTFLFYDNGTYPSGEETGHLTCRDFFYSGSEVYYLETFINTERRDGTLIQIYKYTVYKQDGKYVGALTSDIANGAVHQRISISFLDGQYIYYQCQNSIIVKDFRLSAEGFTEKVSYNKFAFFRFNLETYENEEIKLALLFEKLVPIYPCDPYGIKINPQYKGK